MKKSKLVELFSGLSKEEISELGKYIRSPYHNKNKTVIELFEYLKKLHPSLTGKFPFPEGSLNRSTLRKLDKQEVFKKLFESNDFESKTLLDLMAKLSVLIVNFLTQIELRDYDQLEKRFLILNSLKRRGLERQLSKTINELKKLIKAMPYRDSQFYYYAFRLNRFIYSLPATSKIKTGINSLQAISDNLEAFYVYSRLFYNNEMLNRQKIVGENYDIQSGQAMPGHLPPEIEKDNPLFSIYHLIGQLQLNESPEDYFNLKSQFFNNLHLLKTSGKLDIFIYLLNYCSLRLNAGDRQFLEELFNLYRDALDRHLLIENGQMLETFFININDVACSMQEFNWAKQFVDSHQKYLQPDKKADTTTLCLANIAFSEKDYDNTLRLLNQVEFQNAYYGITAKALMLRSYYELDGYETLFYDFGDAFTKFIRRNKVLSNDFKNTYLNLIRFTRKLYKAKTFKTTSWATLSIQYGTIDRIANRTWLLQKLEELK
ncbi:MAG: hypothetical protein AAF502_07665 [Bacteroidota bacterium]